MFAEASLLKPSLWTGKLCSKHPLLSTELDFTALCAAAMNIELPWFAYAKQKCSTLHDCRFYIPTVAFRLMRILSNIMQPTVVSWQWYFAIGKRNILFFSISFCFVPVCKFWKKHVKISKQCSSVYLIFVTYRIRCFITNVILWLCRGLSFGNLNIISYLSTIWLISIAECVSEHIEDPSRFNNFVH